MNRKYITTMIIILILTITLGIVLGIFLKNNNYSLNLLEKSKTKFAEEDNVINGIELVKTSSLEIKTSPNTLMIFKIYHEDCGHTSIERKNILEDFVNMTKEEIEKEYSDWQVEKFEKGEVIFLKNETGICNEHYVIRDKDGYVTIYNIDASGKEVLKEKTSIITSYLPDIDKKELREGIKIIGKDELNARLEDYE